MTDQKKFVLSNSLTGKREPFKTAVPGKVLFYSCGPTVYGALHIGNARALIFADLLYKWLLHLKFDVHFVRNYTDVDDKIINRAASEKKTSLQVAEEWIAYCEEDIKLLQLKAPTKTVRVTDSIPEIISLTEKIIQNGHAYVEQGEVLFSIESFKSYGALSGKKVEDLIAGARVEVDSKKKSPMDFSLWKPHKKENPAEPFWSSPWGDGRPGWHIECSAMIAKYLGDRIDLHHGGQDLIFPHHENEIAQSEAASGKSFCGHWVHHAFLTSGNEKMSKSLGNILTIREFCQKYSPEVLKYMYLCFHYRSAVPYTEETLEQVLAELERIYNAKAWAENVKPSSETADSKKWSKLSEEIDSVFTKIEAEMLHDLNTPGALGCLFTLIRDINRTDKEAKDCIEKTNVAKKFISLLNEKLFPLWNVFAFSSKDGLAQIEGIRRKFASQSSDLPTDEEIIQFIAKRKQARAEKNFARADEIRKELELKGIILVDTPQGTTWKIK